MMSYYNGNSDIQGGDGLQTLVLMNPGYVTYYSDGQQQQQQQQSTQSQQGNFAFLDSNIHNPGNSLVNNHHHHHHHQQQHTSMAVPPPPPAQTQQLVGIPLSASPSPSHAFVQRAQYMYSPVEMVPAAPREVTPFQQGLSLSLSSQQSRYASQAARGGGSGAATGISNNMLLNSKYLKATQEILEEVVNVGKVVIKNPDQSTKNLKITGDDGGSPPAITGEAETATKSELTTAERQEIQMKKAKLVNMLDEVEQRYRQYHHQMQLVISWFEQAAGLSSAKTYTALALQTISKQFRCLKDTITGQIKAARLTLGESDSTKSDSNGSRLKFVDNQLRQQRALQQLGMIQHNAWRPQRGLPERSVSVLRAWLFEHFLHPYPKDSDKHMLAKQTGLTRSQVSNWFINARVRLWKPMVEEMYLEEIKEKEHNGMNNNDETEANSPEKTYSPENSNRGLRATKQEKSFNPPPSMTASPTINFQNASGFSLIGALEMDGIAQFSPKKPRNEQNQDDFIGGLGGYPIGEIGRFTADQFQQQYSGNGVSLTLGLPHCETLAISGSHSHQSFQMGRGGELGEGNDYAAMNPPSSSTAMYKILPDFVA